MRREYHLGFGQSSSYSYMLADSLLLPSYRIAPCTESKSLSLSLRIRTGEKARHLAIAGEVKYMLNCF